MKGGLSDQIYPPIRKTPDERVSRNLFRQMVSVLKGLHELDIAHRDIKPENFLFNEKWQVKICDFNLACRNEMFKDKNYGTFAFMAPEIEALFMTKQYDGKIADIFALGVTLFLMVTGKIPFERAKK